MDLQKAQAACETLTEQLTNAETAKEKFETEAKKFREEAEIARKTKDSLRTSKVAVKHTIKNDVQRYLFQLSGRALV